MHMSDTLDQNFSPDAQNPETADEEKIAQPAGDFLNLEGLIKNYSSQIENIKQEIRKQKQLLDDSFENDVVYREHEEKAKEANRVKQETKLQILNQPALASLRDKMDDFRLQIKELEATLSDYLLQYQKMTGSNEIEGDDGEIRIIVNTAKLVKGSSKTRH